VLLNLRKCTKLMYMYRVMESPRKTMFRWQGSMGHDCCKPVGPDIDVGTEVGPEVGPLVGPT